MGRSTTPTYRVEYKVDRGFWTTAAWPTKFAGRPSGANLAKHVAVTEASTQPGGCNAHLGATKILAARIVANKGAAVLKAGFLTERTTALMGWLLRGTEGAESASIAYAK